MFIPRETIMCQTPPTHLTIQVHKFFFYALMFIPRGTMVPNSLIHSDSRTWGQSNVLRIRVLTMRLSVCWLWMLNWNVWSHFLRSSLNVWSHLESVFAFVEHFLYRCYRHMACIVAWESTSFIYLKNLLFEILYVFVLSLCQRVAYIVTLKRRWYIQI